MATKHDTWVNRRRGRDGNMYYQSSCLCGWESDAVDNSEEAMESGVAHMVEFAESIPDHLTWINMGVEWLNSDGAKRIVYAALCTCGWSADRQTDIEEARVLKLAHEENPITPEEEE